MQDQVPGIRPISSLNFYLVSLALFAISFIALFIPIMEVDATQYASMSLEMWQNKSWLQVSDLGEAYLDKPPLLFWLSSASIALFGNQTWAFKLPSFIMAWASVYFLYRLCLVYYHVGIAQLAALCYAGSVAFILFTNDIRTDTLMISFVVLATWQLALYLENLKFIHLFWASIGMGFALLAKGPIGMLVPLLAIGPHFLLQQKWRALFKWQVILVPLIILLVLSPMLLGLYEQWGMHGIRFFFWEQSFGRITGENVWQNDATHFYFLHNIAWAFIPFTIFLVLALLARFRHFNKQVEYISLFGLLLPFIALSFSHYKLPHYIYVVIPFAAMLVAKYLYDDIYHKSKLDLLVSSLQIIILFALALTGVMLLYFFDGYAWLLLYVILIVGLVYYYKVQDNFKAFLLQASFLVFMIITLILNAFAYPHLLQYQSSSEAAFYIAQNNPQNLPVYQKNIWWRGFHYYSGGQVPEFSAERLNAHEEVIVFADEEAYEDLKNQYTLIVLNKLPQFSVTRLSIAFLNPKTRESKLDYTYILNIKKTP